MPLNLQNIDNAQHNLIQCDTSSFRSAQESFVHFVNKIAVTEFRHLRNIEIEFEHPVTVISGTNKIGKTSLLLLIACSFEKFVKLDSTSPTAGLRPHAWKDVLTFTSHETVNRDYSYKLNWRVGNSLRYGEGKRLASSKAWSGLGKKSSDARRTNAKIRDREVRLLDFERILPGRSFSNSLFRKANASDAVRLHQDIEQAFAYIFELGDVEIFSTGTHLNKRCFLIKQHDNMYSTFNSASGEESIISLLLDIHESPQNALILIDEVEAGFHPLVQRRLIDIIQYISWSNKKQFVITTHSPTVLSAVPTKSRRFIEHSANGYRVIQGISPQSARSKMDSTSHPLVRLYCEDELASFLISKVLTKISERYPQFHRLFNIVTSGPINEVKVDYCRHKRNFEQYSDKIGYCAVFDGDYAADTTYKCIVNSLSDFALFLSPYEAPEKFLVQAYLTNHSSPQLAAALVQINHHDLFTKMIELGLAADNMDARGICYTSFEGTACFIEHYNRLEHFLKTVISHFSQL